MTAWVQAVGRWVGTGLGLVYPEACQLCETGRAGPREGFVCPGCRRGFRQVESPLCDRCGLPHHGVFAGPFTCSNCRDIPLSFSAARAAVRAEGPALEVIHRYKYHQALWFEPLLGELLVGADASGLAGRRWDAVIPVPLHPVKERERGFNQAERLGRLLAGHLGIPVDVQRVRRARMTATQTRLSREERRRNVVGAFELARPGRLTGLRAIVVDDVFTTGATTDAVAAVLRQAGAEEVVVRTVARGV